MVDHRASPGIPHEQAVQMGLSPKMVGEGTLFEAATMHCAHCGTVVILNPGRTRERASCYKCGAYVCDNCGSCMKDSSYLHQSYHEKLEYSRS
jgi:hypothetical protein